MSGSSRGEGADCGGEGRRAAAGFGPGEVPGPCLCGASAGWQPWPRSVGEGKRKAAQSAAGGVGSPPGLPAQVAFGVQLDFQ